MAHRLYVLGSIVGNVLLLHSRQVLIEAHHASHVIVDYVIVISACELTGQDVLRGCPVERESRSVWDEDCPLVAAGGGFGERLAAGKPTRAPVNHNCPCKKYTQPIW